MIFMLAIVLPLAAQRDTSPARATEPFSLEFLAVDAAGQPVSDLTADVVTVRLDGRVRTARSLEWTPIFNAVTDEGRPALPLPPPFATNTAHDGTRTILFVIDDFSFRPGREGPLRAVVRRFLDGLGPRDQVALATLPYGGLQTDLTTERERVLVELSHVFGQSPATESGSDLACRTRRTLESLTGLLDSLRGGEGPTFVLFFSSRLAGPRRDAEMTLPPGRCELTVDHFKHVGEAAGSARALFYIIQPDDVMLDRDANQTETIAGRGFIGSDNPLEGLEHLSGVTGGRRLHLLTPDDQSLDRVRRETAGYYIVRFDSDRSDRDGDAREVDVRVNRPGVAVRVRPQFTIPRRGAPNAPPTPATMLLHDRIFRGLPLRTAGYVSRNSDDRVKVVTMIETLDPSARLASVAAALLDRTGKVVAHWNAADPDMRPLIGALAAPAGVYRLRVAATDSLGRGGTTETELRAELAPAGALTFSGVVLGLSRSGGFIPRMEFGLEPSALAHLEIYGEPGSDPMWVSFELARTLNGPALVTTPGVIEGTGAPDRFLVTGAIPIDALPPGDYIVRAVGGIKGQPSGRTVRTLRKGG
jgi:VWFA-related protein